jgi:hypothetical protein
MATPAQIAANRANAQKSTGPRTDEGKARTNQNALRHGLCSAVPLMSDELDEDVQQLLAALREEHQPIGVTEEILVYKMAEHFFYGKRASYLLSEQLDFADHGENNTREIGLFMRYHAASDRGYYRALNELRKVQQDRRCPSVQPDATTYPSAARSETSPLILPTSRVQLGDIGQPRAIERDRSIGFVSLAAETEPAVLEQIGSVSQNEAAQPVDSPQFASETPVFTASAMLLTPNTAPVSPQKAA